MSPTTTRSSLTPQSLRRRRTAGPLGTKPTLEVVLMPSASRRAACWAPNPRWRWFRCPALPAATRPRPGRDPSVRRAGEALRVRSGAPVLAAVEAGDRVHVRGRELEVEQLEVLPDALGRRRLREHDRVPLDVPAQHDLGR